jgi:hypothetical protein
VKKNWFNIAIIGCLSISLMGCNLFSDPNAPNNATHSPTETVQFTGTQTAFVSPTQGDSTPMTPSVPAPVDPGLQNLIERTKEDLANRLAIPADRIDLVEITEVEWSDSSLDCPQPEMIYLQVITPGYRIVLRTNGQLFEYHSNRDAYFVYCENRVPPIIPNP